MTYIFLSSEDLHVERVSARVKKGGHHVPEEDVRRRFTRSARTFWEMFKPLADEWRLYINEDNQREQVAEEIGNGLNVTNYEAFANFLDIMNDNTVNEDPMPYMTRASEENLQEAMQRTEVMGQIMQRAVDKARAENTRLGIPNWSWIDGKLVAEP